MIRITSSNALNRAHRDKSTPTLRPYSIDCEIEAVASVRNGRDRATFAEIIAI
jgi:hypothetical protein